MLLFRFALIKAVLCNNNTRFLTDITLLLYKLALNDEDDTLEDMREEKVIMDFPEAAEKIIAANAQVNESSSNQAINHLAINQ